MNPDIKSTVSNSFDAATKNCYWHFVVKKFQNKAFYENRAAIDKKIQEIVQKTGVNSFENKDVSGLTPLHVAVLTGNREGVRFLLGKGASHSIKDDFNCTPVDYAIKYHQEILDLFPALAPVEVELDEIFKKWHVPLNSSPCEYKHQDFGIEIQEMLISGTYGRFDQVHAKEGKAALDVLFDHLEEVMKGLGVIVKRTNYPIAVRDHFLTSANGEIQKLPCPDNIEKNIDKSRSFDFYFKETGYTRNPHPFLQSFTAASNLTQRTKDVFPNPPQMSGYMEGGNAFILTNQNGDPQLLVGKEHFHTTLNCRPNIKGDQPPDLPSEKIKKVAEKMYAQGLLKINGSIYLMGQEKIVEFYDCKKELFKPFSLLDSQIEQCRASVANYLLKKQETKAYIAKGLNIKPENIQSLPQALYHLDVFIKPGPKRSVFVQDFSLNVAILQMFLKNAALLNLSTEDKKILIRLLTTSEKMHQDLGPLLQKASRKIEKAHLTPVPMPGLFFDIPEITNVFNFNCMNVFSGWSKKTERYYYIMAGIKIGERLGDIFMQMVTKYLKSYEDNLDVIFIGAPKEDRSDFTNAMTLWNDGEVQAGPHCYTFETKTIPHTG